MDSDSREPKTAQSPESVRSKLAARFLTPLAAAAASAAAGYAAKKGPDFFERTVLPRLRSLTADAEGMVRDLPAKAAPVASSAGDVAHDVAHDLGERAKTLVSGTPIGNGGSTSARSLREYEKRRDERARSRAERRNARTG